MFNKLRFTRWSSPGKQPVFLLAMVSFGLCIFFSACKKDEKTYDATPVIELTRISSYNIAEGDSLSFTIHYTDGDGDLGENNPDVKNLFLTDTRVNITYQYRVQQLAPTGSNIVIKGYLDVVLNSTAITDTSSSQQVVYSIYMKDRAGHQSNSISSPVITIHK